MGALRKITNFVDSESGDLFLIGAEDIRTLLTPSRCLAALESMYRDLHLAPGDGGRSLGFETSDGKFHVKAGLSPRTHAYFAAKVNANYPDNPVRYGRPTIQGLIVLCDCSDGRPVAIVQSGELTGRRTAAATALAARHGARPEADRLVLIGCGAQARHQVEALVEVRPIKRVIAVDRVRENATALAGWVGGSLGIDGRATADIGAAVGESDIVVTCTTSDRPIVTADMVPKGCFVAAVGADNPAKQEIDPRLFAGARILVDDLDQCASGGDLAHAIRAGAVSPDGVAATLAALAGGTKAGRAHPEEIVIFDSTGTGVQDVAAAAAVYEAARSAAVPGGRNSR